MRAVYDTPYFEEFAAGALLTAQIVAQREELAADRIAKGKLTQAVADNRLRIVRAIAEQWRRVDAGVEIPAVEYFEALGAWQFEMLEELERLEQQAVAASAADPIDGGKALYARRLTALREYQAPAPETGWQVPEPLLWRLHKGELHWRAVSDRQTPAMRTAA